MTRKRIARSLDDGRLYDIEHVDDPWDQDGWEVYEVPDQISFPADVMILWGGDMISILQQTGQLTRVTQP